VTITTAWRGKYVADPSPAIDGTPVVDVKAVLP
jgi:hypothetical protein